MTRAARKRTIEYETQRCEERPHERQSRTSTLCCEYGADRYVIAVVPHRLAPSWLRAMQELHRK